MPCKHACAWLVSLSDGCILITNDQTATTSSSNTCTMGCTTQARLIMHPGQHHTWAPAELCWHRRPLILPILTLLICVSQLLLLLLLPLGSTKVASHPIHATPTPTHLPNTHIHTPTTQTRVFHVINSGSSSCGSCVAVHRQPCMDHITKVATLKRGILVCSLTTPPLSMDVMYQPSSALTALHAALRPSGVASSGAQAPQHTVAGQLLWNC
mmetsp:Transcript_19521/g.42327  ORF Transcript_19521/g.42327 Transcript_19521/m.42327 type:complete len:212 (-) Transcript_19521:3280-3915(-)